MLFFQSLSNRDVEAEAVKFLWKLKRKHFEEEAGIGSKLESIWLFEKSEAEVFFVKNGAGMWKRLNFVESEAIWKKKLEAEANSEATNLNLYSDKLGSD